MNEQARTEIVSYNPIKAAIAELSFAYSGLVFDVSTPKGMADAKAAYKDINQYNIKLEAARTKEKAESLAYGRLVDSEARRISDQLDALRLPIKEQIETETKREQREKEEAMRLAAERFKAEEQAKKDAEEARMAAERAELAKQREAIEAEQREARRKIEEEERAARLAREEADRAARQAREAEEAAAKKIREAEEARLKAERDRIDAEARALAEAKRKEQEVAEAKARAKREAEEAEKRNILRQQAELQDGMEMLQTFVARFGSREEFAYVVDAINTYLRK